MKSNLLKLIMTVVFIKFSTLTFAASVTISSYDATQMYGKDYGYYTGSVVLKENGFYDFSGGSGTINDGGIAGFNAYKDSHLINSSGSVTLYLAEMTAISSLEIFSFATTSVTLPGILAGLNITINGQTRYFDTEGFGPPNGSPNQRDHVHERVSLLGSGLENLVTDKIVLSGFFTDMNPHMDFYNIYISEISVYRNERSGVISEPTALVLVISAVMGLGFTHRRRSRARYCHC